MEASHIHLGDHSKGHSELRSEETGSVGAIAARDRRSAAASGCPRLLCAKLKIQARSFFSFETSQRLTLQDGRPLRKSREIASHDGPVPGINKKLHYKVYLACSTSQIYSRRRTPVSQRELSSL